MSAPPATTVKIDGGSAVGCLCGWNDTCWPKRGLDKFGLHASPGADGAGIQMNEVGFGIIANAALAERHRHVPNSLCCKTRKPNVNSLPPHMKTVGSNLAASGGQHSVGSRCSVSGDDIDRSRYIYIVGQLVHDIKQSRIDRLNATCSKIAKMVADLGQALRDISPISPIYGLQRFECMQVVKMQFASSHRWIADTKSCRR